MATTFDAIEDLALSTIDDYKLSNLYQQSQSQFQAFCDGLLMAAVPNFTQCLQPLTYDTTTRTFTSTFTPQEMAIIANFWREQWMNRYVQTSAQFQAKLQTSGSFHNFSEAQNLKEKRVTVDEIREKTYQLITDYLLQDVDGLY